MSFRMLLFFLLFQTASAFAADSLWQFIPQQELNVGGKRKIIPNQYIIVKLNDTLFRSIQSKTPLEISGDFALLELPSPDHKIHNFRMTQTSTMEKELADKYPELKTYSASEIEHTVVTVKLDYTAAGFHAMVNDPENTWFIDPYSNKNTGYYICYYKKDYDKAGAQMIRERPVEKKAAKKHKCRKQ